MARKQDTDELRPRDRVIAVRPVGTIPEGARGTVKLIVGQAWTRYWVAFDDGAWVNGVDPGQIVREDRYDRWKQEQEAAAARAADRSTAPKAAAAAPAADTDGGSSSGIPAHLLERSRQARARKEAAAAAG